VVSLLLAIPLYLTALVELLLLPAGYGLLELPNSRQYGTSIVVFSPTTWRADLRGGTFLLVALGERRGRQTFFCPDPPRVIRDVDASQIVSVSVQDDKRGTLVQLRSEFAKLEHCAAALKPEVAR
jgi:hypothetical protein